MVGSTEKVMKSTIEAQNREFLTYSLQPWITKIQQELQFKLLPTMGRSANQYTLRFYLDALLAADTLTQTAKQTAGRMGGWLSVNDVREQLGMEPIPGGDEYIVPLNYQAATEASVPEETDNDPEDTSPDEQGDADANDPTVKATKAAKAIIAQALKPPVAPQPRSLFQPLFNDAYGRLQNRAKKDSVAITQTFTPVCTAVGNYFRTGSTVGAAETKAVDKYLTGLETRADKTTADAEFKKLLRCLVFAVEEDAAEARAKEKLEGLEHE
jgi:hypothetical protein